MKHNDWFDYPMIPLGESHSATAWRGMTDEEKRIHDLKIITERLERIEKLLRKDTLPVPERR